MLAERRKKNKKRAIKQEKEDKRKSQDLVMQVCEIFDSVIF